MQPKLQDSMVRQVITWQLVEPNIVGKEILHGSRKIMDLVHRNKDKTIYKLGIVGIGGVGKRL